MAWERRGGRRGEKAALFRFNHPSGVVRTTSSNDSVEPLSVRRNTGSSVSLASSDPSMPTTFSLYRISANARGISATFCRIAPYVLVTITSSMTLSISLKTKIDLPFDIKIFRDTSNAATLHPRKFQTLLLHGMADISTPHLRHVQQKFLAFLIIGEDILGFFREKVEKAHCLRYLITVLFTKTQRLVDYFPHQI